MSRYLLDVNALIALIDPSHVHHERAHSWFDTARDDGWLSCPTTQNGVVRIVSNPKYSNAQPVAVALRSLDSLTTVGAHEFLPDSLTLLGAGINRERLSASSQVTDTYLLALAVSAQARLATFDRRMAASAAHGGAAALFFIP